MIENEKKFRVHTVNFLLSICILFIMMPSNMIQFLTTRWIDWCLTPTLAVFQQHHGVNNRRYKQKSLQHLKFDKIQSKL